MCDHERENVARPVGHDGAVTFDRKSCVALEPGARRVCVTARRIVFVGARRLAAARLAASEDRAPASDWPKTLDHCRIL
jgi:hypothetical protein